MGVKKENNTFTLMDGMNHSKWNVPVHLFSIVVYMCYFQGDSGSPLVCNGVAYGVVSCSMEKLHIYTRIPDYLDWITNTMNNWYDTEQKPLQFVHLATQVPRSMIMILQNLTVFMMLSDWFNSAV